MVRRQRLHAPHFGGDRLQDPGPYGIRAQRRNRSQHRARCRSRLQMGNELIECTARFSGVAKDLVIPVATVAAIYAGENGHGMSFERGKKETAKEAGSEEVAAPPDP